MPELKLAIVRKEKCNPDACSSLCAKVCPVNRKGQECIKIVEKAAISEELCIGCGICQNRCPFSAISIIKLPQELSKNLIYRHGKNGFCLYNLPICRFGSVLGLLGQNGIGKSTALELLSGKLKANLGKEAATDAELKRFFAGSELLSYFEKLPRLTAATKPQNLAELAKFNITIKELLETSKASEGKIKEISEKLNLATNKKLSELSGGELQKTAIAAATLRDADIYFFDEPLAYLDIRERIAASNFIRYLIQENKAVVVVEHDLLLLDYMTDFVNIFYGKPACYGIIASIKASKKAINTYLEGFLKEENVRFRDKAITFKLGVRKKEAAPTLLKWPAFSKTWPSKPGFKLNAKAGSITSKSIVGIAGKNATGKTTFIKCLAGQLETDKGSLGIKQKVSYKPQYLTSQSEETVAQIVKKERINKRLLEMLNLRDLMLRKLNQLSGGELQKVAIASCLAKDADLYLLDEPSAYLDVEERLQAARAIKEVIEEKERAAFVVDHDLLFLSYLADSIIVFSGEAGKSGSTTETLDFVEGLNFLLRILDITVRRDKESGRPRINKHGSLLDRQQKEAGKWFVF